MDQLNEWVDLVSALVPSTNILAENMAKVFGLIVIEIEYRCASSSFGDCRLVSEAFNMETGFTVMTSAAMTLMCSLQQRFILRSGNCQQGFMFVVFFCLLSNEKGLTE